MQASLEHHDEQQMERLKEGRAQYEPLSAVNARRATAGLPPLVPFIPPTPKQRKRKSAK
jgi:hypothetical protein